MATDTCVPLRHPGLEGFGSRQEPVVVVAWQVGGIVVGRTDARHHLCEGVEVNVGAPSNNHHASQCADSRLSPGDGSGLELAGPVSVLGCRQGRGLQLWWRTSRTERHRQGIRRTESAPDQAM